MCMSLYHHRWIKALKIRTFLWKIIFKIKPAKAYGSTVLQLNLFQFDTNTSYVILWLFLQHDQHFPNYTLIYA